MVFASFEEIEAWKNARELVRDIRQICRSQRAKNDFAWVDQITRSSLSVMANIAEGNDAASDVGFIQFLGYAKRSAAETLSHLYYGYDGNYISKEQFDDLARRCKMIAAQLAKLISYLRSERRPYRHTAANKPVTRDE